MAEELQQRNPQAAEVFARANEPRSAADYAEAEQLYRRVRELQLEFYRATLWPINFYVASALAGWNRPSGRPKIENSS